MLVLVAMRFRWRFMLCRGIIPQRGQAQGPRIHPTPPTVPTVSMEKIVNNGCYRVEDEGAYQTCTVRSQLPDAI